MAFPWPVQRPQEFVGSPVVLTLLPPFSSCFLLPGEIALLEGLTVVYKSSIDLYFYVIGSSYENEVRIAVRDTSDATSETLVGHSHWLGALQSHIPLLSGKLIKRSVRDPC